MSVSFMRLQQIREIMKRLILLISCSLGAQKAPLVSLVERNKQADTAFINWRVTQAKISPELKAILTPEARVYLVEQAQLPLDRVLPKNELQKKVKEVSQRFIKKYPSNIRIYELDRIIREVIVPEYVFHRDPQARDKADKAYNELITTLSGYRTKPRTWLDIWALRYLTSEAQFVALSILEKETRNGKSFTQLETPEKLKLIKAAAEVVTRQFMSNLELTRKRYGFTVPPYTNMAVKKRVTLFLREKFGL